MRPRFRLLVLATCAALAPGLAASAARADTAECNAAYVETQQLRRAGKLKSARTAALTCAQDLCSVTVRRDCGAWLEDITVATPTIVIEARDAAGKELAAVRTFVDDELLAEQLDGQALPLDPGAHELRFEHEGRVQIQRLLALEGQAYRRVSVRFEPAQGAGTEGAWLAMPGAAGAAPSMAAVSRGDAATSHAATSHAATARALAGTPTAGAALAGTALPERGAPGELSPGAVPGRSSAGVTASGAPERRLSTEAAPLNVAHGAPQPGPARAWAPSSHPPGAAEPAPSVPLPVYLFGGLGVASLSTFAVLATSAYASERDLRDECRRACDAGRVESVRDRYAIADVALGVGISSLVAAAAMWALAPSTAATASGKPDLQLDVRASGVRVSGGF